MASGIRATKRKPTRRSRKWMRRLTKPRCSGSRTPRKNMTPGASPSPRSLPRNRNRQPLPFDALNSSLRQIHRRALHMEARLNRLTNLATNLVPALPGGGLMFCHALLNGMVATAILLGTQAAFAENRLALVIGQSAYRSVPKLPNPANDATALSQLLSDSGFEVSTAADLSQTEMRAQVGDFAAKVAAKGPDTVALVFYAGHGLQ